MQGGPRAADCRRGPAGPGLDHAPKRLRFDRRRDFGGKRARHVSRPNGQGIWARFDPMKLATPEAFARDPTPCSLSMICAGAISGTRNPTPRTSRWRARSARWRRRGGSLTLVTQNIDDLHERAGSVSVIHMHGEAFEGPLRLMRGRSPLAGRSHGCARLRRLRPRRRSSSSCRVVRRNAAPHGRHRTGAAQSRSLRCDRDLGRRLPGGRLRRRGARFGVTHLRNQPRGRRQRGDCSRTALRARERDGTGLGRGSAGGVVAALGSSAAGAIHRASKGRPSIDGYGTREHERGSCRMTGRAAWTRRLVIARRAAPARRRRCGLLRSRSRAVAPLAMQWRRRRKGRARRSGRR